MRHVVGLLCLFSALSLVSITGNCTEDKPWYEEVPVIPRAGGVLAPASPQDSIRMDSMEINILAQTGSYVVDAVFRLFNTGEATSEWIGFPKHCRVSPYVLLSYPKPVIHDFIRFEGWVNGSKALFMERRSLSER